MELYARLSQACIAIITALTGQILALKGMVYVIFMGRSENVFWEHAIGAWILITVARLICPKVEFDD